MKVLQSSENSPMGEAVEASSAKKYDDDDGFTYTVVFEEYVILACIDSDIENVKIFQCTRCLSYINLSIIYSL